MPLQGQTRHRLDGQWFADLLGIDPAVLDGVEGAHGVDQRDARAMQALLWPATMGYLLGTQLEPVFSDETVEQVRWFFTHHVRGRGSMPAFRVGRQPYGVTATTAFSRSTVFRPRPRRDLASRSTVVSRLDALLTLADADWDALVATVPSLGRGGSNGPDAHQTLLGVLGLHASSVEFHYRYAEGIEQLVNKAGLSGFAEILWQALLQAGLDGPALDLLGRFGYTGERPPLLSLYFHGRQAQLAGPLVDDRPLSETEPVRVWATGERNYLQWLLDAATTSLDAVRAATGFVDTAPNALLYLLARHAVILGYAEGSRGLHHLAGYSAPVLRSLRQEPAFVHVAADGPSESRYASLYRSDPLISPGTDWTVAAQITHVLRTSLGTRVLRDQVEALEVLADASTARLERALAEHIDTVTYRFDAWRLGLVNHQLEVMRGIPQDDVPQDDEPGDEPATTNPATTIRRRRCRGRGDGVSRGTSRCLRLARGRAPPPPHPGARRTARRSGGDLRRGTTVGTRPQQRRSPSCAESQPGGHGIRAPRRLPRQRVPADPEAMTVNLSSERVRKAIDVLDGMRNGQSLAELLGYALGTRPARRLRLRRGGRVHPRSAPRLPAPLGPVAIDEAARGHGDRGDRGPQRRGRPAARRARRAHRGDDLPLRPPTEHVARDGHARPARRDRARGRPAAGLARCRR